VGRAFADIMNEIGASKNATTWIDRTNYFETVPAGYLEFAIELEADRMRNAYIADVDRRSEMTVVRNELERNDNNNVRVLNSAVVATAFREHPYHHPTIGWRPDVENVETERLRELYDTYYHPNNATAFVIGDFDEARTRDAIERHFGALPHAPISIPDVYTDEPPQAGERSLVVKRPGDTTLVAYAFHTPAAFGQMHVLSRTELARRAARERTESDIDGYALEVLSRILGRGRTSRFSRALVDTGLALDVSAWNWDSRDPGLFQILVNVTPGRSAEDVRREIETVLATIADEVPSVAEVERAQTQIVVQRAFARDGTYALASRLGEFEAVGSWRLDEDYVERIREVTPERVRAVAHAYLHEDNRTVGVLLPATAKTFDVVPFEPVEASHDHSAPTEAAPLPGPRSARHLRFAGRIANGTLSNGTSWNYVASPETPTVHIRALLEAGPAFTGGRPVLASVAAEMLMRGTRRRKRQEIEERLERAGVRRAYYVDDDPSQSYNPLAFRITGASVAEQTPLLLETIAEELTEPAFDPAEFELVKVEIVGALRHARSNTGWRAAQRFLELAYESGDPNAAPDVDAALATLEALTLDDVRAFHERSLLGVAPLVSGAGALEEPAFARLLETTLGAVPLSSHAAPGVTVRARPARDVREDVVLERKANVDIVIGRATSLVRAGADFQAAQIGNGILGQSTLSSRLGLRLRDREGLTYGVTSAFSSPGRLAGPWRITVSVNPANVERALESVRDVLREYVEHGPTERELVMQRNSMAGQHHVRLATSAGIAGELERMAYYDLGKEYVDTYREELEGVDRAAVTSAVRRYFDGRDLIVSAAGTFE
jgi:zinc protease